MKRNCSIFYFTTFLGRVELSHNNRWFLLEVGHEKNDDIDDDLYIRLYDIEDNFILGRWINTLDEYLKDIPNDHIKKGIDKILINTIKIQAERIRKLTAFA